MTEIAFRVVVTGEARWAMHPPTTSTAKVIQERLSSHGWASVTVTPMDDAPAIDALQAENERLRAAIREPAQIFAHWRSTIMIRYCGITQPTPWRELNKAFDTLAAANNLAKENDQ